MLETWFLFCFGVWGIILDHLQKASDQPEGQELGGGAVGGQEGLQDVILTWGVTQHLSMLETWFHYLKSFLIPYSAPPPCS